MCKKNVILGVIFIMSSGFGNLSYWNKDSVRKYAHHSELQRRWAWRFLAPHLKALEGDEKLLDIGCGDGKNTADISSFLLEGTVTGIDPSSSMIKWAERQYHLKEYPNLHFKEGDFFTPNVEGPFDIVVSLCSIHHAIDQKAALIAAHRLLKREGKILILVPSTKESAWREAVVEVIKNPKWSSYWKDFTHRVYLSAEEYHSVLEETNFEVISINDIPTVDPFVDEEELAAWMEGTYPPFVPSELRQEFYKEIITSYLEKSPSSKTDNGVICVSFDAITVVAKSK